MTGGDDPQSGPGQVVQERLNSVEMPEGLTPQMAPISSLMGQIMLIGMHRQDGPRGGRLATVPQSDLVAELVLEPGADQVRLYFWDPMGSDGRLENPHQWRPVAAPAQTVVLTWRDGAEAPGPEVASFTSINGPPAAGPGGPGTSTVERYPPAP